MTEAHQPGSYLGVRFSPKTIEMVERFCEENDIPNAVPAGELHTTLIYSERHLPGIESESGSARRIEGIPASLELWGESGRCLVLVYDSPGLSELHDELKEKYGATHTYPEYTPHITLSYDIGDYDTDNLRGKFGKIQIVEIYHEDLNTNWAQGAGLREGIDMKKDLQESLEDVYQLVADLESVLRDHEENFYDNLYNKKVKKIYVDALGKLRSIIYDLEEKAVDLDV